MTGPAGTVDVVDDVAAAFTETVVTAYAARSGPRFVLVLSGGPTARRCYEALAQGADKARAVLLTLAGWTSPRIAEAFSVHTRFRAVL